MQATSGRDFRAIASAAFRTLVLIAIAILVIFVLLPAALVGAAT
jgi:hypothetical protein